MVVVPLLAKNTLFLRGLERYGVHRATIDRFIKQIEVAKLQGIMGGMRWRPSAWLGVSGGLAFMATNIGMRLFMSGLALR
jgi:hypothetical protein